MRFFRSGGAARERSFVKAESRGSRMVRLAPSAKFFAIPRRVINVLLGVLGDTGLCCDRGALFMRSL